jgi:hypothetical protein
MSDKAAFDPSPNAENAAAALDKQINQITKPGDGAATVAHEALLALQNDAIPTSLQVQVHTDLLAIDPQADAKLKQFLPDFTLTDSGNGSVMKVTDNNPPQDVGVQALSNMAMQAGGEIFSTNKVSADTVKDLAAYGQASDQGEATAFVNNDLQLLGVTNEQVVANDKQPGLLKQLGSQIVQAAIPGSFSGVSGEYDLVGQDGSKSKLGTYSEKMADLPGTYVNVDGMMVPTPGNALTIESTQSNTPATKE